jgi:hypothetical protein
MFPGRNSICLGGQNTEYRIQNPEPQTPNLKPTKPPPNIVAAAARPLLADALELEGVRSVGAVKWC